MDLNIDVRGSEAVHLHTVTILTNVAKHFQYFSGFRQILPVDDEVDIGHGPPLRLGVQGFDPGSLNLKPADAGSQKALTNLLGSVDLVDVPNHSHIPAVFPFSVQFYLRLVRQSLYAVKGDIGHMMIHTALIDPPKKKAFRQLLGLQIVNGASDEMEQVFTFV
jgi:hypothetical protein